MKRWGSKKFTRHASLQRAGQHYLPLGDFSASGTGTVSVFFAKLQAFCRILRFSNFCRRSAAFQPVITGLRGAPSA